jgi:carboxylate-amine ligase
MDYGRGILVPFIDLVDEWVELISEDARELGCLDEVEHAREIARHGSSSSRQLSTYEHALEAGADDHEALEAVVDELISDTVTDT